jgi:hypothetical protein
MDRPIAFPLAEPDEGDHEEGLEPGQPPAFRIHTLALGLGPLHHLMRKFQFLNMYTNKIKTPPERSLTAERTGPNRCLAHLSWKRGAGACWMEAVKGMSLFALPAAEAAS